MEGGSKKTPKQASHDRYLAMRSGGTSAAKITTKVKIAKQILCKANSFACSLATVKPGAATLQRNDLVELFL